MTQTKSKILVTGGCGYLGSALLRHQLESSQHPTILRVLDNMSSGSYQALSNLPGSTEVEFIEADILDPVSVRLALHDVDTVVHLAAIVTTPVSFQHSRAMEQINHWGTVNLLNTCVEAGVKNFIYASSSAVYGPGGPFTEEAVCRPVGSYASSLLNAEIAVRAAFKRGMATTILRFGMIYGLSPVMRFDNVVNRHALLCGTGRSLSIFGDGTQKRPVIHVRDACNAIVHCIYSNTETPPITFNAHAQDLSVGELTQQLKKLRSNTKVHVTEQDVLTHLSFENDSNYLMSTGWTPQITLAQGLSEMVTHFRNVKPPAALMMDTD